MPVMIALLRAVNVGGRNQIKMEALRGMCEKLGWSGVKTLIQSGNVVFRCKEKDAARKMGDAIEKSCGFRPEIMTRTTEELRSIVKRNPFAKRREIEPNKLHVYFLTNEPAADARAKALAIKADPEEFHIDGREIYIYFPNGAGQTKLPPGALERALKTPGTGRNWNTVTKLLEMAEELEAQ